MTIENLNSRTGQSNQISNYMLTTYKPGNCSLIEGVHCKSYSPHNNIHIESSLIQGEISKAILRKPVAPKEPITDNKQISVSRMPLVTKEHKSVKSEQILNRIDSNILPYNSIQNIPRNKLFGIDTRSVIKYA